MLRQLTSERKMTVSYTSLFATTRMKEAADDSGPTGLLR
jgi:hypothetical protein